MKTFCRPAREAHFRAPTLRNRERVFTTAPTQSNGQRATGFTLVELPAVSKCKRNAFTLVELLVVIAIIGVLVALLLPAVQAAREAARRTLCLNHVKQVGLGLHNYTSAHRVFPPGMQHIQTTDPCTGSGPDLAGYGWGGLVLPFIEEHGVYDQINFRIVTPGGATYGWQENFRASGKFVSTYICPSVPIEAELVMCCSHDTNIVGIPDADMASTHLAGVADSVNWTCGSNQSHPSPTANGMLFNRSHVKPGQITDGTSKTLLVGEIIPLSNIIGVERRSMFWATWDILHTANGINLPLRLDYNTLPNASNPWGVSNTGFASYHPGGCHFALADGSVHFIQETISPTVLAALTTRSKDENLTEAGY